MTSAVRNALDAQRKLIVLRYAKGIGNVGEACSDLGVARSSFYRARSHPRARVYKHTSTGTSRTRESSTCTSSHDQPLTYTDDVDLNSKLARWEAFYNHNRPHGAHGGKTSYEALRATIH